ncbi:sugar MFS transporter [Sphaerisporangium melleum]|uniref:MFS transporter n=1 Tax=Sphaerisporangium melleum TaxID=321316 RepID=UPI00166EB2B2|nr:MFS transporter [Sphaerisporangium melleum]
MSPPASPTTPARLVRDGPTWLIYLQISTSAAFLYGLSAAIPLLRIEQKVSQAVAGLHGTAIAVGAVVSGLAIPWLVSRLGRRRTIWLGLLLMGAGVALLAAVTPVPATLSAVALAGTGSSITLYVGMSVLSDHHGRAGAAAINEANAVAVTVGIGMSYLVSLAAAGPLGWRAALLVTPLATLALIALMGRVRVPDTPAGTGGTIGAPLKAHPPPAGPYGTRFHIACAVLFCVVAAEFLFNFFAAKLLADQTGMTAAVAATALTAFTAGIATGRFAGGRLALRAAPAPLLAAALVVTCAGWAVFWLSTHPVPSYAGLALSGAGVAMLFPLGLSRVIAASGGRPDQASAAASIWAGVAVGTGPFALGALADAFGTRTAFLLVPLLITLALTGVAFGGRSHPGT